MTPPASGLAKLSKHLRLGRLLYLFWHKPRATLAETRALGGLPARLQIARGMRDMERAATLLPQPARQELPALRPELLTGHRFWYQTAFCLHSLGLQSGRQIAPVLHDDGSLTKEDCAALRRRFPLLEIQSAQDALAQLDRVLPRSQFPCLRERHDNYPHIRKLLNVHAGRQGWRMVLDSDLLFFQPPSELLAWMDQPGPESLHATDCEESYGYTSAVLSELGGGPLPPLLNVGLCGLQSDDINWKQLEHWTAELLRREGTSYYLEQALVALLLRNKPRLALDAAGYRTLPDPRECAAPSAKMHHYVASSKHGYFTRAWKRSLQR